MISAIIFIFWPEEENYIESCLKTVSWCDEIVVIDNGASLKTLELCRKFTTKIYKNNSDNFADRHNFGKEKAKGDWLLYLDADERISAALKEEIEKTVGNSHFNAYKFNRVNFFLGKEVKFGDRYPDLITRLFKRDTLISWEGEIHESSNVSGSIGSLSAPLYHLTHRDITSMLEKTINFSQHEAALRLKANHPPVVGWRLIRVFLTEFWMRFIKYQGFRQGTEGYIDGIFQAFSMFITYARLWELQRKKSLKEEYEDIDKHILQQFK